MSTRFVEINPSPRIEVDVHSDLAGNENVRDRIFAMTDNLIAFASLGPLTCGHTLICPRFPSTCIGDVISDAHVEAEFMEFCNEVTELLKATFGKNVLMFEHGGSSGLRPIGCSVLHAHLHVVPGVGSDAMRQLVGGANALTQNGEFVWEQVKGLSSTRFPAASWQDYLFIAGPGAAWLTHVMPEQPIPHQYLRQRVGEAVGNSQWDWRRCPNEEVVEQGLRKIGDSYGSRGIEAVRLEEEIFTAPFMRVDFE